MVEFRLKEARHVHESGRGAMPQGEDPGRLACRGLILLDPADNCYVVTRDVQPGDVVDVDGDAWIVAMALSPGHKIARWPIAAGGVVTKLGVPIGVASMAIGRFEHIHLHNLSSQYIPTHERGDSLPSESE
jgi:altronate dehydratase small subunit